MHGEAEGQESGEVPCRHSYWPCVLRVARLPAQARVVLWVEVDFVAIFPTMIFSNSLLPTMYDFDGVRLKFKCMGWLVGMFFVDGANYTGYD